MIDPTRILAKLRREPHAHKGDFGRVLVLAGSTGFAGAACLCAQAALASGAGLVTLGVPWALLPTVAAKLTACMTRPFRQVPGGIRQAHAALSLSQGGAFALGALPDILAFAADCDVVALGPGIGRHLSTQKLVHALIHSLRTPLVIDADGLNALEGHTEILTTARCPLVLTPHPGEMARLTTAAVFGEDISPSRSRPRRGQVAGRRPAGAPAVQTRRAAVATEFARANSLVLVLKGHRTVVADGREVYENHTGNPGMASGGTGDVLTGLVAGLVAQRLDPFEAACLAVYLHGLAGDLAVTETGEHALTATTLLEHLGGAFLAAAQPT